MQTNDILIIEKKYSKKLAFERLVKIYYPGCEKVGETKKIVEFLGIGDIFTSGTPQDE